MEISDIPHTDGELFKEIEELDENLTMEQVSLIRRALQKEIDLLTEENNPQQSLEELELSIKGQR